MASASHDKSVNVWNILTWTSIQRYANHTGWVRSLDQIDNDTIVSGSRDNTICIWKISTGETMKIINANGAVFVVRVFSIEYKQIACGNAGQRSNLQIYNYETGDLIRTLYGHSAGIRSIEMLSGQFMASGGGDQSIFIWDPRSASILENW